MGDGDGVEEGIEGKWFLGGKKGVVGGLDVRGVEKGLDDGGGCGGSRDGRVVDGVGEWVVVNLVGGGLDWGEEGGLGMEGVGFGVWLGNGGGFGCEGVGLVGGGDGNLVFLVGIEGRGWGLVEEGGF